MGEVSPEELRAAFPLLHDIAYLNAGTCGPVSEAAVKAQAAALMTLLVQPRSRAYFDRTLDLMDRQRAAYAQRLGAAPADVALTTSTSEGVVRVLAALDLGPGDEIVTSDEEHPGVLGPLAAARARTGVQVRMVPLADVADAVGPATRLVACSHVSWVGGAVAPAALAELSDDVGVLLDGAQAVGAVTVDVGALGCAFYAGSGQKWLCGPVGTGMLYVAPAWAERLRPVGPTYVNLEEPSRGLEAAPHADARRHDASALSAEACAFAVAAHDALEAFGWPAVHERATSLATRLAAMLAERGRTVAARGETTLVSFEDDDPPATRERLAERGVVLRDLPGRPLLRASVGAWNDESDLQRLVDAL